MVLKFVPHKCAKKGKTRSPRKKGDCTVSANIIEQTNKNLTGLYRTISEMKKGSESLYNGEKQSTYFLHFSSILCTCSIYILIVCVQIIASDITR